MNNVFVKKASSPTFSGYQHQYIMPLNKNATAHSTVVPRLITADQTDVLCFHPFESFFVTFLDEQKSIMPLLPQAVHQKEVYNSREFIVYVLLACTRKNQRVPKRRIIAQWLFIFYLSRLDEAELLLLTQQGNFNLSAQCFFLRMSTNAIPSPNISMSPLPLFSPPE
jgi:hypothetical protein